MEYSLQEIANWQLSNNSEVELPTIQRGFVWKVKQIEGLWDSILRRYPIGSFLFSRSESKYYLMDGQQRSTAIFLGFYNPFENKSVSTWSIKNKSIPIVWIDIKPDEELLPIDYKYLIRVVTQSHPWGYQAKNNDTRLSVSDRRKSLEIFCKNDKNQNLPYISFENTNVFPYDCCNPIPISFLLEAESVEDVIDKVEKILPEDFSTKKGNFSNRDEFVALLKGDLKDNLQNIHNDVQTAKKTKIYANVVEQSVLNEEQQENPTLFVRMNSSGTALTGDDLIYSIYKSIFPKAKELIEGIKLDFIAPVQILSLINRIVASELVGNKFIKKIDVKDFQRRIKNEEFRDKLRYYVENDDIKKLFSKAIDILSCKDNSKFEGVISPILIKEFISKNKDLYLFLVYWLHIHREKELTEDIKLKIASKLFVFSWFSFTNIPKLWNEKIGDAEFWTEPINNFMWWNDTDGIHFLIPPELLEKYYNEPLVIVKFQNNEEDRWDLLGKEGQEIKKYFEKIKEKPINEDNKYFSEFIEVIKKNKSLVLFAQREYINTSFLEFNQMETLDDTNSPWDWDHIYPSEWVYNRKKINKSIKDWNDTIGNYRAISLEHNRSRGNTQAPSEITDEEEQKESFIDINKDWKYWQKIQNRINDDKIENHFKAVTTRMVNIYRKFWEDMKIQEIIK